MSSDLFRSLYSKPAIQRWDWEVEAVLLLLLNKTIILVAKVWAKMQL
jgi:hypothetical protein